MKKSVICILLVLAMLSGIAAMAEGSVGAINPGYKAPEQVSIQYVPVRSVTVVEIVVPTTGEVVAAEDFSVYLPPLEEETVEHQVFEEIKTFVEVEAAPVIQYFPEETVAAIVEKLPETVVVENMQMDEFFPLKEVGYDEAIGDVEVEFQFVTEYKDEDVVIALVGVPVEVVNEDGEIEIQIKWTPVETRIVEGKVKIIFPVDVLKEVQQGNAMLALLREGEPLPEGELAEETEAAEGQN